MRCPSMPWLPARAELTGQPGRALIGGALALAAVVFLVHGSPPGMTVETPVDLYPTAKFSRTSLLPHRQLALYLALSTPAGTALVRTIEDQALLQAQFTFDEVRSRRLGERRPVPAEGPEGPPATGRARGEPAVTH